MFHGNIINGIYEEGGGNEDDDEERIHVKEEIHSEGKIRRAEGTHRERRFIVIFIFEAPLNHFTQSSALHFTFKGE